MIEEFELRGEWWIPSSPNNRIIGTLTFDPINGGSLELDGFLNNELRGTRHDIIHGVSSEGNDNVLTLQDLLEQY
jgi:hypothetical protein